MWMRWLPFIGWVAVSVAAALGAADPDRWAGWLLAAVAGMLALGIREAVRKGRRPWWEHAINATRLVGLLVAAALGVWHPAWVPLLLAGAAVLVCATVWADTVLFMRAIRREAAQRQAAWQETIKP